jgi:amino acid adenylation domain-containing protein
MSEQQDPALSAHMASRAMPPYMVAPALAPEEWQMLVKTRNATQVDYGQEPFAHHAVEWHATQRPAALAVSDGERQLTYGELNAQANQLAHMLIQHGIGPEDVVGICLDRSLEMIVALIGVHKAGGAYLPIDPAYPAERRAYIMQDARIAALITRPNLVADVALPPTLLLFPHAPALQQQPQTNPAIPTQTQQLAYIIYTSGSTGVPKGVQIAHSSLLNLIGWYRRAYAITTADRMSQFISPGFDANIIEFWPCFASGASMHIVEEEVRLESEALRDWLVAHRITIAMIPTALAEQLVVLDWPSSTALRFLQTGAEALRKYPGAQFPAGFINNYGPAETTVLVTVSHVTPSTHPEMPPSIGRPIANTSIYLLDEHLNPVPDGAVGELYVGGTPVGRGYVGRPALTAERFIPDPFSAMAGARLYRTGDLCRYRANGEIEFVSRTDDMIKIRGYRIELGEIEAVLLQQPTVREAVVVAREDDAGEKRLVAYVTAAAHATPTAHALRAALQARLPGYMVPTAFVVLGTMPITPNGKIDRRALPAPNFDALATEAYRGPRDATEAKLTQIWADTLALERIGIDDDLFALGTHSLMATRICSRTREAFHLDIPIQVIFEEPTIAKMALYITRMQASAAVSTAGTAIPPIRRGNAYLDDLLDQLEPLAEADTPAFFAAQARRA